MAPHKSEDYKITAVQYYLYKIKEELIVKDYMIFYKKI